MIRIHRYGFVHEYSADKGEYESLAVYLRGDVGNACARNPRWISDEQRASLALRQRNISDKGFGVEPNHAYSVTSQLLRFSRPGVVGMKDAPFIALYKYCFCCSFSSSPPTPILDVMESDDGNNNNGCDLKAANKHRKRLSPTLIFGYAADTPAVIATQSEGTFP